MSNRRFIVVFLVGIACAGLLLAFLSFRASPATIAGSVVAASFGADEADGVEIFRQKMPTNRLERTAQGAWRLVRPFAAAADASAVERLLDAVLLVRPGDRLTPDDLRGLRRTPRDFGFDPPRAAVAATAAGRRFTLEFGGTTPSGTEVYARLGPNTPIFTVPQASFAAVPADLDAFRRRQVFSADPAVITTADFRVPGATFVKLVRSGGVWRIVQPEKAPAEAAVVKDVLDRLLALRVERFVWPDAWTSDGDADPDSGKVKAARLASYGIDEAEGLSVALWTSPSSVERIVFGSLAGTNGVYALVHGGATVVTVDASIVDLCRTGREKFLDARVFPFGADALRSVSVTAGGTVYVLAHGTNGQWRIESPVVAPADERAATELVDRVLRLRQNDRVPESPVAARVAVTVDRPDASGVTNLTAVAVRGDFLATPANLRAKQILAIPPPTVRRLSVLSAGGETAVEQDVARGLWRLAKTSATASAINVDVSTAGVSRVLATLADVRAVSVESLNAAPEDFRRCGLARPAFTIAVDVEATDAVRRNLLLGNAAPGGGRYATAGGADALFIISRETVAGLTVPLTESELADIKEKAKEKK